MCDSDSGLSISMHGSQNDSPPQGMILLRIIYPDESDEMFSFCPNDLILDVKRRIVDKCALPLKDKLNYGLFLPPSKGKAGKFLQEERTLEDYPFENSLGHLELKYKQRVYRTLKTSINKLQKINNKANYRQFMECIRSMDVDKTTKWLNKGLDPNFQWKNTGETPLTIVAQMDKPTEMIMALVAGGAHLDYRAADSMTPLHKAAVNGNLDAVKVLLDFGQSPNTRDKFNLTPLYYTLLNNTTSTCVERLLFDHSVLGVCDEAGLQEIHQACRFGRVQQLEILLSYGADLNVQTTKNGNTPLHICAYTGQETCARLLLFRGADKTRRNFSGHTAQEQAIISEHPVIGDLIKNFHETDVVLIRETARRNDRRRSRSRLRPYQRCASLGRLNEFVNDSEDQFSKCAQLARGGNEWHTRKSSMINQGSVTSTTSAWLTTSANIMKDKNHYVHQSVSDLCRNPINPGYSHHATTLRSNEKRQQPSNLHLNGDLIVNDNRGSGNQIRVNGDSKCTYGKNESASDTASIFSISSFTRVPPSHSSHDSTSLLQLWLSNRGSIVDLDTTNLPRMIALQRGAHGFGFVIRGKKGIAGNFEPTLDCPATQYLEKVEPQSAAYHAGLKSGDFILEVNGVNVTCMSHDSVVGLIRGSGDILGMKVMTVDPSRIHKSSALSQSQVNVDFTDKEDVINVNRMKNGHFNDFDGYSFNSVNMNPTSNQNNRDYYNGVKTICRDKFHQREGSTLNRERSRNSGPTDHNCSNGNIKNLFPIGSSAAFTKCQGANDSRVSQSMMRMSRECNDNSFRRNKNLFVNDEENNNILNKSDKQRNMDIVTCQENVDKDSSPYPSPPPPAAPTVSIPSPSPACGTSSAGQKPVTPAPPPPPPLPPSLPPPPPPQLAARPSRTQTVPPPPPLNAKPALPVPPLASSVTNGLRPQNSMKNTQHNNSKLASIKTVGGVVADDDDDDWSDTLTLPPPPSPLMDDDNALAVSNKNSFNDRVEENSVTKPTQGLSFDDHLREAIARRRRIIEMGNEEDASIGQSISESRQFSKVYVSANVAHNQVGNSVTTGAEKQFVNRTIASSLLGDKLTMKSPTMNTIPPPERFKDQVWGVGYSDRPIKSSLPKSWQSTISKSPFIVKQSTELTCNGAKFDQIGNKHGNSVDDNKLFTPMNKLLRDFEDKCTTSPGPISSLHSVAKLAASSTK